MHLKHLSDEVLLAKTKERVSEERRVTTLVLRHLHEIERRRLFAARGFASLFEYAVRELGYSESSAQRRVASMRLLREIPEMESKIEKGALSLSVISQAQTFFRQEKTQTEQKKEILKSLEGKSSREAEKLLASRSTHPAAPQERIRAVTETLSEVKFLATDELLGELEKLKGLLAHQHPNASLGEILQIAVKIAVKQLDPAQKGSKPLQEKTPTQKPTRFISQSLKAFIWKRDQSQCAFVEPATGRRCASKYALEIDHKIPFALGGPATAENLRLLCAQHNRFEARKAYGPWVDRFSFAGRAERGHLPRSA